MDRTTTTTSTANLATLTASDALDAAVQAARFATRSRPWLDTDDVASESLARLLATGRTLTRASVNASVRLTVAQSSYDPSRAGAHDAPLSLDALDSDEPDSDECVEAALVAPVETASDAREQRVSLDGLTLSVLRDRHGLDTDSAVLTDSDGTVLSTGAGAVLAFREAQRRASVRLVSDAPVNAGAAARAASAVARDALVLSVVGLAWQDALAVLASHGLTLSRGALREAQRVARRRASGLSTRLTPA